jgi:hypothetical protein
VVVGLKFEAGIVAIQSHSLVEKLVIILALMTSPGNVTRSFVLVRIFKSRFLSLSRVSDEETLFRVS